MPLAIFLALAISPPASPIALIHTFLTFLKHIAGIMAFTRARL